MKKLFVAGCSFSDFTKVTKVYGQFLAEKLKYQYIHEGAGCGSNWRIWRTITKHIMSGNLTPNDLLIVQYTGRERQEFFSALEQPKELDRPNSIDYLKIIEKFNNGNIIRYKAKSHVWQHNKEEQVFFELYEKYFVDVKFSKEQFITQNYLFQKMLLSNNINAIFVDTLRSHRLLDSDMLPEYLPVFREPVTDLKNLFEYNLEPNDFGHKNQLGHEIFAEWLFAHINNNVKDKL
jgi:hypothetical protein